MPRLCVVTLLLCVFLYGVAHAQQVNAISAYSQMHGLDPALVKAIAVQESSFNPLTINVAGEAFYPKTKDDAVKIINKAWADGSSFDVGLMQINSWWMREYGINPVDLLDIDYNVSWGTKILAKEIATHGYTWKAIGKYHSPNAERGRLYAWKIHKRLSEVHGGQTTQKDGTTEGLLERTGLWRNPKIERNGRIITFSVRKENVLRLTSGNTN